MGRMPATVIVDVQNVYALSGDVLGTRSKPTPDGIAAALAPYGLDVDKIDVPIGLPDAGDIPRVLEGLRRAAEVVSAVDSELSTVHAAPASSDVTRACGRLANAHEALCKPVPKGHLPSTLEVVNALAEDAVYELRGAVYALSDAIDHLRADAGRRSSVPSESVLALDAVWHQRGRLEVAARTVGALSSYAWAARNNLGHHDSLVDNPEVVIHRGRFRPGYEGGDPDEKQVDTLCAVACLDRTRTAVSDGGARAIVVMSDDDDLTPALRATAKAAAGTDVRVIAAGTAVVSDRLRSSPPAPDRPRWLILDQNAWHRVVGNDPVASACARHQLARLALGNPLPFVTTPDGPRLAVTRQGLRVQLASTAASPPAVLSLDHLEWRSGRDKGSHVPRAVVGPVAGDIPGRIVRCAAPQGNRLSVARLPVTHPNGHPTPLHVRHAAPGWWMADDELVIARPATGGGDSWRIVGPTTPKTLDDLAGVERGKVMRLTASKATWATVKLSHRSVTVLVTDGVDLHVGDEVAVVAYERVASGPPVRALLVSSAL